MSDVEKRNQLDEEVFSYRVTKDQMVFISWQGKRVTVLKDYTADKFIETMDGLDGKPAQRVMARMTGNFRRGNERKNQHYDDETN